MLLALQSRVSPKLWSLLVDAIKRSLNNDSLDKKTSKTVSEHGTIDDLSTAGFEALLLKCILDHLVDDHKDDKDWSIRATGFEQIEEKFEILVDSHAPRHKEQIQRLTNRWGEFFLGPEEKTQFSTVPAENQGEWLLARVESKIRQVWFLYVSICRLLQESDNFLSAEDAYWVGLIDEIIGRSDLPSPRAFVEYAPDE